MNKKRIINALEVALFAVVLIVATVFSELVNYEFIEEGKIPLSGNELIKECEDDINVIPDKYSTGCNESKIVALVKEGDVYSEVPIYSYGTDSLCIRVKDTFKDDIVFENLDFTKMKFVIANDLKKTTKCKMRFVNCKFSSLKIGDIQDTNVEHIFDNCSFIHFAGSNSTFNNCYFGSGAMGDGINPYRNCFFNNCMIADLVKYSKNNEQNHVDGLQIFGDSVGHIDNTNIHLNNCRFEVPNLPFSSAAGVLNCPITFTMRYSNASNVSFNNLIVNGGTYYSIMLYSDSFGFDNITLDDIRVGGARKSANIIGDEPLKAKVNNVVDTDSLYVGSVWKNNNKIHLSVTNDTNQERTLKVITSKGESEIKIAACPVSVKIVKDSTNYEDLPFDIDVEVGEGDWVVCYDITDGINKQIRFVNWSGKDVYITQKDSTIDESVKDDVKEDAVAIEKAENDQAESDEMIDNAANSFTDSGKCGNAVEYSFDDGVMTLSGEGDTFSYNSSKPAPWNDYRNEIQEVVVEEGISGLGNHLFVSCTNLTSVEISEGLETINGNCFMKSTSLESVSLPASIKYIGKYAFASTKVNEIIYAGTEIDWDSIVIEGNNGPIQTATKEFKPSVKEIVSGECGTNATWVIYDNGELVISGQGSTGSYNSSKVAPWCSYSDLFNKVIIGEGITEIGTRSFGNCTNIESVECAESVVTIGGTAFVKCTSLKEIYFGSGLKKICRYAFSGTALQKVYYNGTKQLWSMIVIEEQNAPVANSSFSYN